MFNLAAVCALHLPLSDAKSASQTKYKQPLSYPHFQALENIKEWLAETLYSDAAHWIALQNDILQLADALHPETCRTYGDFGGMNHSAQTLQPFVEKLFARPTPAALGIARDCLYWNDELCRLRPDWQQWLNQQTAQSHAR